MKKTAVLQAITTKYLGPTNKRGSRIKAIAANGDSIIIDKDNSLHSEDAHRKAAEALQKKLKWDFPLIQGGVKSGYVFVAYLEV
jgi:hypothetical protein